ncbi:Up-regulated during septation-domain-containing protein [Plectosphaerella cucumerina]|uniref:Up-regulated during septation-domain-containing protein n=1 Tax=Plectosphaerella cucumerina TaxID=40658 RepID=A0A8K0X183_9PEZI|nr:Up-regulated during septation-domain-containing protein [Plectosphaerella cucumerina]
MQQPADSARKYQLFPKGVPVQPANTKALDPEQAKAFALGQNAADKTEQPKEKGGLRIRIKEHTLIRRRKVSVPELGPMTTVQEVAMDSPTIPGRPPIHERSISAPGNHSWRHQSKAEAAARGQDTLDEKAELDLLSPTADLGHQRSASESPKAPMSPKNLAPLIIPPQQSMLGGLTRQLSKSRLRSGSNSNTPVDTAPKSSRIEESPRTRTPFTPLTASTALTAPLSASTAGHPVSSITTPVSAPPVDTRNIASPWETKNECTAGGAPMGHRRGASESGSIMERGRPRKRSDQGVIGAVPAKRPESRRKPSVDQKVFDELPTGYRPSEAATGISPSELMALQKQAFGQVSRFEVLRLDQVEALSKELRQLDDRTEYLRRTYNSLRSGRRNLHSRICQYLRSPRVARFSTDSMLKQEEALAELDASIDDWVSKLEQAENRRSRVRQKLLEHVAAAATLPAAAAATSPSTTEVLQQSMGTRPPCSAAGLGNISTPPRSPTKTSPRIGSNSPSPQRVVPHVPSTILEVPIVEEPVPAMTAAEEAAEAQRRIDVQSIRVYADSDVYALLADVENEITKMSAASREEVASPMSEDERKELHRARSHEMLQGRAIAEEKSFLAPPTPIVATSPDLASEPEPIFLTSAVFKG